MIEDPSKFFTDIFTGYRKARALTVAGRLGVFGALETGASTTSALARHLDLDAERLQALLEGLVSMEVLELHADRFALSAFAIRFLVPSSATSADGVLRYQHRMWDAWEGLEQSVRSGKPWRELVDLLETDDEFRSGYLAAVAALSRPTRAVAERLAREHPKSVLDLGGGSGTFAVALAQEAKGARVTLFDLPGSEGLAAERLAQSSVADRVSFRGGNYLVDGYGSGHDLILMSHTTHDEGPDSVASMLSRAHAALVPGGQVAIHDWVVDDDRMGPDHAVFFSLNLMLYTKKGRLYSRAEYRRLLEGAGFTDIRSEDVLAGAVANPTSLLLARKK